MGPGRRRSDTEFLASSSPNHRVIPAKAGIQPEMLPRALPEKPCTFITGRRCGDLERAGHPVPGRAAPGNFARARAARARVP